MLKSKQKEILSFLTARHDYLSAFHRRTAPWWALLQVFFFFFCTYFGMKEDALIRATAAGLLILNRFILPKSGHPTKLQSAYLEFSLAFNLPFLIAYTASINDLNIYWNAALVFGAVFYSFTAHPAVAVSAFPFISFVVLLVKGFDFTSPQMLPVIATVLMAWVLIAAILVIRQIQQSQIIEIQELHHHQILNKNIIERQELKAKEDEEMLSMLRLHFEILQTYVNPSVRNELSQHKDPRKKPREDVHWVVFYSDVMGYTKASKALSPQNLGDYVNGFFDGIIEGVFFRKNGEVDKLMGDAVMGLFHNPDKALNSYLQIKKLISEANVRRVLEGKMPYRYGIGMSFGAMAYGNYGNGLKMDRTVVGSVVNDAQRIEKLCREYDLETLVTEAFVVNLSAPFEFCRPIDYVTVGESDPMVIYELFGHENGDSLNFKMRSIDFLASAISHRKAGQEDLYNEEISRWAREMKGEPGAIEDNFFQSMLARVGSLRLAQ